MRRADRRSVVAARQSRRRRVILKQRVEYGVWTTRHSESVGEDYDWRSGSVHADRVDALTAVTDRFTLSAAIKPGKCPGRDANTGTITDAECSKFTGGECTGSKSLG